MRLGRWLAVPNRNQMSRDEINAESLAVEQKLKDYLTTGEKLVVVKAPPGSGWA